MRKDNLNELAPKAWTPGTSPKADSPLMQFYGMTIARPEGVFKFNLTKQMIMLGPEHIAGCLTEEQMNKVYMALTDAVLGAIDPIIMKLEEKKDRTTKEDSVVAEYKELWTNLNTCMEGYISVRANPEGDEAYEFAVHTKNKKDDFKVAVTVQSQAKDHTGSTAICSENLYRNLNCTARPYWRQAYRLAIRSGFIDPEYEMNVANSDPQAQEMLARH